MDQLSERLARLSPTQLSALIQRLGNLGRASASLRGIPRRRDRGPCPLSFAQQRLWFIQQLDSGSTAYHDFRAMRLEGRLDAAALQGALDTVVRRHEALRTVFVLRDGEPVQQVVDGMRVPLEVEDLTGLGLAERDPEVDRRARREQARPFALSAGPLLRATLLRLGAGRHVLLLSMHHVISDGWSRGVIVREISAAYTAALQGVEPDLPALPVQYPDYAVWQRDRLRGAFLDEQLGYWREKLAGAPPQLELPTDRPRPPVQSFAGGAHRFALPDGVAGALRMIARQEGATLFMVLLAAFKVLLARYTGQPDLVVGTPVANRARPETAELVGFFANTLALRTDLAGDPTFREALRRVRDTALGAYAHEELPFERVVEALHPERSLSRNLVFQVMFLLDEQPVRPFRLPGLELAPLEVDAGTSMFDLTLALETADGAPTGRLEYAAGLFDTPTIGRMAAHLCALLRGIAADPDARISALPLMSESERLRLAGGSATVRAYPSVLVHELFAAQAGRTPDAPALVFRGEALSYGELEARANRLAHHLRGAGVGPEVRVGICMDRSPEMVVALLGVLTAGGAYVPLDPAYPRERLGWMVGDAGIRLVLTTTALVDRLPPAAEPLPLDALRARIASASAHAPASGVQPENLSHVIFTSGSTGRPKGVMVRHSSTAALLHWMREAIADAERASVLASTSISFDVSVAEIFGALCWGGTLVLVENALDLPAVAGQQVRSVSMVPTAAAELLRAGGIPQSVRTVNLAGEALPNDLAQGLYALGTVETVRNLYGPTEDTSYSTCSVVPRGADRVLIGRPLANSRAYVLDDALRPAPVGVPGELYLAGDGLARGYQARPALTAGRFLPDPSGPAGSRMYRTMDRVRWTGSGELEYFGRTDFQVKVRGFRIELGEIETALRAIPSVADAVVVVREDAPGDRRLVAYVIAGDGAEVPPAAVLRAALKERLPEYMVPGAFVVLDALPRTGSGKVDRGALPPPDASAAGGADFVAPRTPVEELLAGIVAGVLGVERVGVNDGFFDAGGHSLLAMRVVARVDEAFGVALGVRALFEAPTVAGLAARVEALRRPGAPADATPLVPVPRDGPLPLSFAQRRLWLIDQLEPGRAAYNLAGALRIRGALDVPALERSLTEVVRRHEALRTRFASVDGEPVQVIEPAAPVPIPVVELTAGTEDEREAALRALAGNEALRPFDLAAGPLLRSTLVRLADEEHALLFTMHHVISDGWSIGVLVREVSALYAAFTEGRAPSLPPLPVQYADYAAWQRARLAGPVLDAQLAYWREALAGAPPRLELPADRPRPPVPSDRGAAVPFALGAGTTRALRALSRREGATMFMTLLAAWQLLLSRYSGQDDVLVGSPIAGRGHSEVEGLIGFFVNTLVLRADLSGDPPFRALLGRVREAALGAYAHQEVPFEKLVEELQPERSRAHTPFFQVMFSQQDAAPSSLRLGPADVEALPLDAHAARNDLSLAVAEEDDALRGLLTYRTDRFDAATAGRMLGHYAALLTDVAADATRRVSAYALLDAGERRQVLETWNATAAEVPDGRCVHALFAAQAARTPDAPAVVFQAEVLTYAELDRRANRLAHHLRALGVDADARVGLCLERGVDVIAAILGILKAGGAYLPLDPAHPAERLLGVLADADAPVLITGGALAGRLSGFGGAVVRLDADAEQIARESADAPAVAVFAENLAYVLYTSGSTGRPKGVMVRHGSVVNLHAALHRAVYAHRGADAAPRVSVNGPVTFDTSVKQVVQLLGGATLCIIPEDARYEADALAGYLREHAVEVLDCTPAQLRHLMADGLLEKAGPALTDLLVAGEAIDPALWATLAGLSRVRAWNLYGPTETTVDAALRRVSGDRPLLGGPIANARLYVLDAAGAPAPVGVPGELHVGGAGVARGYLGQPALTAARFVPDAFSGEPGARLYRTGDRVRWSADGETEYLGRTDFQLKVSGFRIEPGEIETALQTHPAVRRAVVIARNDGDGERRLVGYVVAEGGAAPSSAELRAHLKARLPDYMVPAAFVALDALPLTRNGKVDRQALPAPGPAADGDGGAGARTPTEEIVAGIFADVLGSARVGARDDFFALGGHSLRATQVATRVRAAFGTELPLRVMFDAPTPAGIAAWLDAGRAGAARDLAPIEAVARPGEWLPLSHAQQRLWLVDQMAPESRVYNQGLGFRLRGRLDAGALHRALTELVRRHAVFRTRFVDRDGVPGQVIDPPRPVPLPLVDLAAAADREDALRRIVREQARQLFDLGSGTLLRVVLVRLADADHALVLAMHHVTNDGWSGGILLREVAALYGAFAEGRPSPLPEPALQYADYAAWQRAWLTPEREGEQLAFWSRQLEGIAPLHLATDRTRAADGTDGETRTFTLSPALSEGVRRLSRALGATPFMTLLAAFEVLLHWQGRGDEVVVGTDVANRNLRAETEGMVGFFVNQLVLRTTLAGDPEFRALVGRVREATLAAYDHQDVPFDRVVEVLRPRRAAGETPFFRVKFVLQNAPAAGAATLPGLVLERIPAERGAAQLDVLLAMHDDGERLSGLFEYRTSLFSPELIARWVRRLEAVLEAVAADPAQRLEALRAGLDAAEVREGQGAQAALKERGRARFARPNAPRAAAADTGTKPNF
jgi:amino acid adenylation domain-containing protein